MRPIRHLFLGPVTLAVAALLVTATIGHAYPPPAAAATTTQGCPTVAQGSSCPLTFHFVDGAGNPVSGAAVQFTVSGPGSVSPTTGVTNASGDVVTTFTASAGRCGNATITATSGSASTSTVVQVVCAASNVPLPNTSGAPGGTSPLAYIGIVLAMLILVGGAITLRRTRRTA